MVFARRARRDLGRQQLGVRLHYPVCRLCSRSGLCAIDAGGCAHRDGNLAGEPGDWLRVLGYPWTVDTILWGFVIGAAALLAAVFASAAMRLLALQQRHRHRGSFCAGIWCLRRRLVPGDL